jgi:hypothetical protein
MSTPVDPLAVTQPMDVLADTIQMRRPRLTTSSFTSVDADWFDGGDTGRGLAIADEPPVQARSCPLRALHCTAASLAAAAVVVWSFLL